MQVLSNGPAFEIEIDGLPLSQAHPHCSNFTDERIIAMAKAAIRAGCGELAVEQ
jgi:hypothetical protein